MDLLVVRFHLDKDIKLVFQVIESDSVFSGLRLVKIRGSTTDANLRPELMDIVFAPKITRVGDTRWTMQINPLTDTITIEKRPSGKYLCFYPFDNVFGTIQDVWVDGSVVKKTMWFTIHATFQASKDAAKQHLQTKIDCSDEFVRQLISVVG